MTTKLFSNYLLKQTPLRNRQICDKRYMNHTLQLIYVLQQYYFQNLPPEFPINPSSVVTQNCNVLFVATKRSLKNFDELDPQHIPEKKLHQLEAQMICIMGEQHADPEVSINNT